MENLIGKAMIYYFIYSGILINIILVVRGLVTMAKQLLKGGK